MNAIKSARPDLLKAIAELSALRPEWRLGQLIANLAMSAGRLDAGAVWDLEDEEALAAACSLIDECRTSTTQTSGFPAVEMNGRSSA